jgi:plastocyanin
MQKYINILIFVAALSISFLNLDNVVLKTSAQNNSIDSKANIIITINPGAIDTNSQSPVTPKDITIPVGTTIIWLNKDSSPHLIASGTPDKGPTNIFYGNYFDSGQAYNVTLDKPGIYGYYDPGSPNINGSITVVAGNNLFSGSQIQTLQSPGGNNINNNNNNGVLSPPIPQQQPQSLQPSDQSILSPAQQQQQQQSTLQPSQQASNDTSLSVQTTTYLPEPLQGTYVDNMSGLRITFPSGWNGHESIDSDNVKTITFSKQPSPSPSTLSNSLLESYPPYVFVEISPKNLMLNTDKQLQYKNIINYDKMKSTNFCNLLSSNNFTIDLVPSKEIIYSCPFPFNPSVKELTKAIPIEKGQTNIAIGYIAVGESNYKKYLPDFENSIQSIKFSQ